jgi:hypothetical protein
VPPSRPRIRPPGRRPAPKLRRVAELACHPAALPRLQIRQPTGDRDGPADRDQSRGVPRLAEARVRRAARRARDQGVGAPARPAAKQLERWRQDGGDPDQRPRTYFRLVPVFAQDQVAPLPPPAEPAALELPIHDVAGDELAPIIPKLDALAHELGCPVEEEPMSDGCHGYYEIDSGRIAIDASLSANGKVKTRCTSSRTR